MLTINLSKGVKYMFISTFCFTVMQSLVKYLHHISIFEQIFFRSIIGSLICIAFLKHQKVSLKGKNNKMLIYRALVGSASLFSFFFVLSRIHFGTALAFKYMSPIFTTILAMIIFKEKVSVWQLLFLILAFGGLVILKGFDESISFLDLSIGLFSALCGGLLIIIIRKIGDDDHHLVILNYFMIISAIISGMVCIFNWVTPNLHDLIVLLLIGIVGFTAQNFFTISLQQDDKLSMLSILRYSEVVYAFLISYFIFNESYPLTSILGVSLIIVSVILSILNKTKKT